MKTLFSSLFLFGILFSSCGSSDELKNRPEKDLFVVMKKLAYTAGGGGTGTDPVWGTAYNRGITIKDLYEVYSIAHGTSQQICFYESNFNIGDTVLIFYHGSYYHTSSTDSTFVGNYADSSNLSGQDGTRNWKHPVYEKTGADHEGIYIVKRELTGNERYPVYDPGYRYFMLQSEKGILRKGDSTRVRFSDPAFAPGDTIDIRFWYEKNGPELIYCTGQEK